MNSPFIALRELVNSFSSPTDACEKLPQFIEHSSVINSMYLGISIEKDRLSQDLSSKMEETKKCQIALQKSIYRCQTITDQIQQEEIIPIDESSLDILPLDEFEKASGIDPDTLHTMSKETLLKARLQYEQTRAITISKQYDLVAEEYQALGQKFNATKQKYARLLMNMQEMLNLCQTFATK